MRFNKNNRDDNIWRLRYGSANKYRGLCKSAHRRTHNICSCCLTNKSTQIHHAYYGNDIIGESIFPVCRRCHYNKCHHRSNWIRCPENPVWRNRNTEEFIQKLRAGYESLVNETAPIFESKKKIKLYRQNLQITSIHIKLVITLKEAAIMSGLSTEFLKNQINTGNLNAIKIGQTWMTRPIDIDNLLNILSISPPQVIDIMDVTESIDPVLSLANIALRGFPGLESAKKAGSEYALQILRSDLDAIEQVNS